MEPKDFDAVLTALQDAMNSVESAKQHAAQGNVPAAALYLGMAVGAARGATSRCHGIVQAMAEEAKGA